MSYSIKYMEAVANAQDARDAARYQRARSRDRELPTLVCESYAASAARCDREARRYDLDAFLALYPETATFMRKQVAR